MPAPKGISIPEVSAFRLDERILDSRTTKGWPTEDKLKNDILRNISFEFIIY